MNSVKKIIVLGGHGETGRRIVGNLSLRYPDLQVTIGSRRAASASGRDHADCPDRYQ
ncbi:hypothetical protein P4054_23150 [Pseudomonas aeruginosa]|nr:hypothetical protein [Pseudomonas aeruginosa]